MSSVQKIRIFVASTSAEWLPLKVLEFSIRETSIRPVDVVPLFTVDRDIPVPQAIENRARTPFSFQRFLIPEACDFTGKAIYLDADMLVFQDIGKLWDTDLDGCDLQTVGQPDNGRRGQFSVMLLDCERLCWNIDQIIEAMDAGSLDYAELMYEMKIAKRIGRDIPASWNALEQYELSKTCLLHYTDMNTQPWISTINPLGHLWMACLRRALAKRFIQQEELIREIEMGHIRPSLLFQVESGIDDCIKLPASIRKIDKNYLAPFRRLQSGKGRPWTSLGVAAIAFLRRSYYRSRFARFFG